MLTTRRRGGTASTASPMSPRRRCSSRTSYRCETSNGGTRSPPATSRSGRPCTRRSWTCSSTRTPSARLGYWSRCSRSSAPCRGRRPTSSCPTAGTFLARRSPRCLSGPKWCARRGDSKCSTSPSACSLARPSRRCPSYRPSTPACAASFGWSSSSPTSTVRSKTRSAWPPPPSSTAPRSSSFLEAPSPRCSGWPPSAPPHSQKLHLQGALDGHPPPRLTPMLEQDGDLGEHHHADAGGLCACRHPCRRAGATGPCYIGARAAIAPAYPRSPSPFVPLRLPRRLPSSG